MFKKFKIITLILAIVCAFSLVACDKKPNDEETTAPTLSVTEVELKLGDTVTLEVTDYEGEIEWAVGDYKIATVDNGVVTAVGIGQTEVICIVGDTVLTCKVTCTIDYVEIPRIILLGEIKEANGYKITLDPNRTYELTPALIKDNKQVEDVTFTLSSENAAVTTDGMTVKGVSVHSGVTVTISCEFEGSTYTETLTVVVK